MINSLLDSVLDRTMIGGYTNVGYRIRSRGWPASELPSLRGRVVIVTGATSGLGLAAAEGFARLGATVWLVARSQERGEQARAAITERSSNHDVHVGLCDLSDLQSVRQFAERLTAPGVETSLPRFHRLTRALLRTPEQGADTIVWLGAADEPGRSMGLFWHDRRPRPTHHHLRRQGETRWLATEQRLTHRADARTCSPTSAISRPPRNGTRGWSRPNG